MRFFRGRQVVSDYGGPLPGPELAAALKKLAQDCCWKPDPDTRLDELRYLVVDTETTGLSASKGDQIIAVGGLVVNNRLIDHGSCYERLVNPYREIPPLITELTGISEEMVENADDVFLVLSDLLARIKCSVVVGHNLDFDLDFINRKLAQVCGMRLGAPSLDTLSLTRALNPRWASYSLDIVLAYYQIQAEGRHTALGDATLTATLFSRLLDQLENRGICSYGDLQAFLIQHLDYHRNDFGF